MNNVFRRFSVQRGTLLAETKRLEQSPEISAIPWTRSQDSTTGSYSFKIDSAIITVPLLHKLQSWMNDRFRLQRPIRIFNMDTDGTSLTTVYSRCSEYPHTAMILVFRDSVDRIFGVFLVEPLYHSGTKWFGGGESFLFTLAPTPTKYPCQLSDTTYGQMICVAAHGTLTFGAGPQGYPALYVSNDLGLASSEPSATFGNPSLFGSKETSLVKFEVFAML